VTLIQSVEAREACTAQNLVGRFTRDRWVHLNDGVVQFEKEVDVRQNAESDTGALGAKQSSWR
jgi:hypothetical protein